MINPDQIRAARALLRWSAATLAKKSGISVPTIQRIEGGGSVLKSKVGTIEAIHDALRGAGVSFIAENGGGVGVRFAAPIPHKKRSTRG